jgi:hypothetical protein
MTTTIHGQIRGVNNPHTPNELAVHRVRLDGRPGCGDRVRSYKGDPLVLVPIPPHQLKATLAVSIGMCGRHGCWT